VTLRTRTVPPAVIAAIAGCVETDRSLAVEAERLDRNRGRHDSDVSAFENARTADDEATHELGAACWEWLKREGVVAEVEKGGGEDAAE
jgi:hypothetical protein